MKKRKTGKKHQHKQSNQHPSKAVNLFCHLSWSFFFFFEREFAYKFVAPITNLIIFFSLFWLLLHLLPMFFCGFTLWLRIYTPAQTVNGRGGDGVAATKINKTPNKKFKEIQDAHTKFSHVHNSFSWSLKAARKSIYEGCVNTAVKSFQQSFVSTLISPFCLFSSVRFALKCALKWKA